LGKLAFLIALSLECPLKAVNSRPIRMGKCRLGPALCDFDILAILQPQRTAGSTGRTAAWPSAG